MTHKLYDQINLLRKYRLITQSQAETLRTQAAFKQSDLVIPVIADAKLRACRQCPKPDQSGAPCLDCILHASI